MLRVIRPSSSISCIDDETLKNISAREKYIRENSQVSFLYGDTMARAGDARQSTRRPLVLIFETSKELGSQVDTVRGISKADISGKYISAIRKCTALPVPSKGESLGKHVSAEPNSPPAANCAEIPFCCKSGSSTCAYMFTKALLPSREPRAHCTPPKSRGPRFGYQPV